MDQNQSLRQELKQAFKDGHFVYIPSRPLPMVNGLFVPHLEKLSIPADGFYETQGKFGLSHFSHMQLARAAGCQWAAETGRVGRVDNMNNPNFCQFRVVAQVRGADGLFIDQPATKHLDLDAKQGAIETKHAESFDFKEKYGGGKFNGRDVKKPWPGNKDDYIRKFTERDINQLRENMDERCESGAQVRAIRNLLGLPTNFPADQKNKSIPAFVAQHRRFYIVQFILDPTSQEVKAAQLASFQQAITGVYGFAPAIGITTAHPPQALPARPMKDVTPEPQKQDAKEQDSRVMDFENIGVDDQVSTIMALIKNSGYEFHDQDMQSQKPLEDWTQEDRTKYFIYIKNHGGKA